jgi:hypothetical protein
MEGGHRTEGGDQERVVLAGLDGPDGENVPPAPLGQPDRQVGRVPRVGPVPRVGRQQGDPVVDRPDPGRVGGELGHDLVGHEPGRRVDPRPLGDGPPDQGRELQGGRVAQLGVAHDGEIMDGHHPRRPAGRGDHEVRAVDDVPSPDEPLDGGQATVAPGGVERPCRHGPLVGRDAGGHQGGDSLAAAPADGKGRHVDAGQVRQPGERPDAERPHAGRPTEQGGGVEPDRQLALVGGGGSLRRHARSLAHAGMRRAHAGHTPMPP